MPLGPFKITLSTPELPQVQPAELAGRIKRYDGAPTQKTINNLMKQIRKIEVELAEPEPTGREPRPIRHNQRDLAQSYNRLAYNYCDRGEFDKGRAAADQALSLFDAAGAANEPVSSITGLRANILRTQIRAAYHLGMAGELRRLRPELADNLAMSAGQHAEKGYTLSASTLYMDAAGSCWDLAEELLVLGVVDPNGARAVWEEGIPHARKAGAESIDYPDWWPR